MDVKLAIVLTYFFATLGLEESPVGRPFSGYIISQPASHSASHQADHLDWKDRPGVDLECGPAQPSLYLYTDGQTRHYASI